MCVPLHCIFSGYSKWASLTFYLQGSPQFIILDFSREVSIKEIQVQFQGGFVGKECQLEGGPSTSSLTPFYEFYPDDVNSVQVSFLPVKCYDGSRKKWSDKCLYLPYLYVYQQFRRGMNPPVGSVWRKVKKWVREGEKLELLPSLFFPPHFFPFTLYTCSSPGVCGFQDILEK